MEYRRYSHGKLVSWSQRKCIKCQKYLSRRQILYCAKHRIGKDKEDRKRYERSVKGLKVSRKYYYSHREQILKVSHKRYYSDPEFREKMILKCAIRYNAERFQIGDYI